MRSDTVRRSDSRVRKYRRSLIADWVFSAHWRASVRREKVLVTSGAHLMRMRTVKEAEPSFATCFRNVAMMSFLFLSGTRVAHGRLCSVSGIFYETRKSLISAEREGFEPSVPVIGTTD